MEMEEINKLLAEVGETCFRLRMKMMDYREEDSCDRGLQDDICSQLQFAEETAERLKSRHESRKGGAR